MYIQITTRCNMACEHCCNACTLDGEDMSIETFKKALDYDDYISIGGGEPTIHPKFWEFIGLALGRCESVWLATNGSITDTALALARMAKKGVLACALSQDAYHDAIAESVVRAFTKEKKVHHYGEQNNDFREIRNVNEREINGGRCDFGEDGCSCPGLICKPNGEVLACGCDNASSFGNVHTEIDVPEDWDTNDCYKEQELVEV